MSATALHSEPQTGQTHSYLQSLYSLFVLPGHLYTHYFVSFMFWSRCHLLGEEPQKAEHLPTPLTLITHYAFRCFLFFAV